MARFLALVLLIWAGAAPAQQAATLLADSLRLGPGQQLIASGNVEVVHQGSRLRATAITYDGTTDRLEIAGPILLTAPDGSILTADAAALSTDLRNGLLTGARLVLDRQLQLAAGRIDRIDGRYTALTGAAVTACPICNGGPPLWEIRAAQVVHDQAAQQLYFDNAQLRVGGVPLVWLPRLRLPDPTLDRATGVLIPRLRTTDRLGFGVKLPYFITLGDHRDLTLTPYLSSQTTTLEARYRQAFARGDLAIEGALSRDSIRPDTWRGYLLADGNFRLGPGRMLDFELAMTSDAGYLFDYGLGDPDRLHSHLTYQAIAEDSLTIADISVYESLRGDDDVGAVPPVVADWRREWHSDLGPHDRLSFALAAEAHARPGADNGPDARDGVRLGAELAWQGRRLLGGGLVLDARVESHLDWRAYADDPALPQPLLSARGGAAFALSWPLTRATAGGTQVLEPLVALTWRGQTGDQPPNDDAVLAEFDPANLTRPFRTPGQDGAESGLDLAIGLRWAHLAPSGREVGLDLARIFRPEADSSFAAASGLGGRQSDWLIGLRAELGDGFSLQARSLFDDRLSFGKTEARVDWEGARVNLSAAYVWLPADAAENRDTEISEWTVDAAYRLTDAWTISADARYDIAADEPARAGLGLTYRGACVTVDLSVDRRYTSTEGTEPETDFGLSVTLDGFSTGRQARVAAHCG